MARQPSPPAKPPRGATAKPAVAPKPEVAASKPPAAAASAAAPAPKPAPVAAPPSRAPTPAPPAAATLSLADVKLLRDRLDAVKPGVPVAGSTPSDQLLAAMAAKLDAARTEDRATIAALEKKLAALTAQVAELEAQAADVAANAAAASGDHTTELGDALAVADKLLAELARTRTSSDAGAADLATAKVALGRAQREVADLRTAADPKSTGATVLGAETVASLLNDFVGSFKSQLSGLAVASGEVSLKAGFAQLGKAAGFVLPTAGTPAASLPVLHEITLRLDTKS